MSFPFFLIGPMLKIISGVVQYAIDSSKDAAPEPSSISRQAPTVEFSPLLAELLGAQAYANAMVPTGWLTPAGDPNASITLAEPSAATVVALSAPGSSVALADAQPVFANASLRPVFVQGKPALPMPGLASESTGEPLSVQLNTSSLVGDETVSSVVSQAVQQPEGNGLEKPSVGGVFQGNAAKLISGHPSIESAKEQSASGTARASELPIMIDASSRELPIKGTSAGQGEQGVPFGSSDRSPHARLTLDPLPASQSPSAQDRAEPFQNVDLTVIQTVPSHAHRITGLDQAGEAPPLSPRELPGITEQLVHAVRINVESGRTEARLHLEPPDLGPVRIQMVMDQQALSLRFHAGSDTTRALLEASLGELRDNLAQQGISVGQMSVGLTLDLANQNGGQLPAPWMVRDERWPSTTSTRTPEPQLVPAPQISLSALDLFA
jgi:flagellar hook-length control protein FliK